MLNNSQRGGTGRRTGLKIPREATLMWVQLPPLAFIIGLFYYFNVKFVTVKKFYLSEFFTLNPIK